MYVSALLQSLALLLFVNPVPPVVVTVGGAKTADFATVQAAIDHLPAGGETILLAPGIYREKLHIIVPNVHLVGTGSEPSDVVLSWMTPLRALAERANPAR